MLFAAQTLRFCPDGFADLSSWISRFKVHGTCLHLRGKSWVGYGKRVSVFSYCEARVKQSMGGGTRQSMGFILKHRGLTNLGLTSGDVPELFFLLVFASLRGTLC